MVRGGGVRYCRRRRFSQSVKLTEDGTVIASGDNEYGECNVQNWRDIIAVARGQYHTVGLKKDGTVLAVGDNRNGQCNVADWTNIVSIYAQDRYTAGLKADGTVVAVGYIDGDYLIRNWRDVVLLRGGWDSLTCLRADGSVATTKDRAGELKDFNDIVDVYTVFYTIGLRANGTVVAAMPSYFNDIKDDLWRPGKVDKWEDIVAIACGSKITVGLKSDGTVVYAGAYSCDISQWKDIVAINIKDNNTVRGLRKDGHVCHVKYRYNCPKTSVSTNKMFENFDTLEQEIQEARQKRAEEKRLKLEEEKKKTERRQAGKCQHCGGEFKGLFTKKCANCGNPRDY